MDDQEMTQATILLPSFFSTSRHCEPYQEMAEHINPPAPVSS